jgi:glycosyltransferase involved in cell wall biosynthesis
VCEFSARALADKDGFTRGRIRTIPNGIDMPRYEAVDKTELRQRLGLIPNRTYVTIVARFHPVKDHATLLHAFRDVAGVSADVDLLLVGDGPLRGEIERQISELGMGERVRLVGIQSNVPDWLRASDIFALSSVSEAASITLLEAMASGLPAIVTAVGGNPELVRDGVNGLLVARGDVQGFSQAILKLLREPLTRMAMGASGMTRVRDEFLLDDTIRHYARLYDPSA